MEGKNKSKKYAYYLLLPKKKTNKITIIHIHPSSFINMLCVYNIFIILLFFAYFLRLFAPFNMHARVAWSGNSIRKGNICVSDVYFKVLN